MKIERLKTMQCGLTACLGRVHASSLQAGHADDVVDSQSSSEEHRNKAHRDKEQQQLGEHLCLSLLRARNHAYGPIPPGIYTAASVDMHVSSTHLALST